MTYLLFSPQQRPQYELSFRGNLRQLVEFKKYAQKNNSVQNPQLNLPVACPSLNLITNW